MVSSSNMVRSHKLHPFVINYKQNLMPFRLKQQDIWFETPFLLCLTCKLDPDGRMTMWHGCTWHVQSDQHARWAGRLQQRYSCLGKKKTRLVQLRFPVSRFYLDGLWLGINVLVNFKFYLNLFFNNIYSKNIKVVWNFRSERSKKETGKTGYQFTGGGQKFSCHSTQANTSLAK